PSGRRSGESLRGAQGGAGGRASSRPPARSSEGRPRPVEPRRERGRDPDAAGPAGLRGADRQDPGGRPEHAALLRPITPPRTQETTAGLKDTLAPIGQYFEEKFRFLLSPTHWVVRLEV